MLFMGPVDAGATTVMWRGLYCSGRARPRSTVEVTLIAAFTVCTSVGHGSQHRLFMALSVCLCLGSVCERLSVLYGDLKGRA